MKLALRLCGASAVQLRPGDPVDFEELDGFVITGGHDIQPVLYRAAAEAGRTYDPERDAFESAVIDHALAQRLPLLAICRGAQLMNVRLGGSLIQDLTLRRKETSNRRTLLPLKSLAVEPDTLLERALRTTSAKINSLHRQAIDDIGEGLEVSGTDRDQIVQAVEHPGHDFMLAVQWHPEMLDPGHVAIDPLLTWLVQRASN